MLIILRRVCLLGGIRENLDVQPVLGCLVGRLTSGVGPDGPKYRKDEAVDLQLTHWTWKEHSKLLEVGHLCGSTANSWKPFWT